jgi:ABC-type dipeptide/oligopeptide/nickel transport system permease component
MFGFIIKRSLLLIPVFFAASIVVFLLIHLVPGDPVDSLLTVGSPPEQRQIITERYGLDKPLIVQYGIWIGDILRGDLGTAIIMRRPVADLMAEALPYSIALGASAFLFYTIVGVTLGVTAALFRDRWPDRTIMTGVLFGSTLPSFWLGLLLMLIFSVWLRWLPVSGARGVSSLVLPVLGGTALVARITRVAMVETQRKDFVMLLHAKGMHPLHIQLVRVLRHALIPVVTILALRIGFVLGGAITVEIVFARPGIGTLLVRGIMQHDYPVVQACLLMLSMAVILGTFLGDVLQALMDPRARVSLS